MIFIRLKGYKLFTPTLGLKKYRLHLVIFPSFFFKLLLLLLPIDKKYIVDSQRVATNFSS